MFVRHVGLVHGMDEVPKDPEQEAHLLLEDVRQLLEAGGVLLDDLVCVQVFCPDVSQWESSTKSIYLTSRRILHLVLLLVQVPCYLRRPLRCKPSLALS